MKKTSLTPALTTSLLVAFSAGSPTAARAQTAIAERANTASPSSGAALQMLAPMASAATATSGPPQTVTVTGQRALKLNPATGLPMGIAATDLETPFSTTSVPADLVRDQGRGV